MAKSQQTLPIPTCLISSNTGKCTSGGLCKMFSSTPELIIPLGRYDAKKYEYRFREGDDEYVFDAVSQKLRVLR